MALCQSSGGLCRNLSCWFAGKSLQNFNTANWVTVGSVPVLQESSCVGWFICLRPVLSCHGPVTGAFADCTHGRATAGDVAGVAALSCLFSCSISHCHVVTCFGTVEQDCTASQRVLRPDPTARTAIWFDCCTLFLLAQGSMRQISWTGFSN